MFQHYFAQLIYLLILHQRRVGQIEPSVAATQAFDYVEAFDKERRKRSF